MAIDTKHCRGCRNDFYNGHNPMEIAVCWSLGDARLVRRWEIHNQCPPTRPGAFTRVRVPQCYHKDDFSYYDELPECARGNR